MDTQKILDAINTHRRRHGAADLQWDATCAAAAQNWANRGYVIHEHDGGRFGESLAVTDTNFDATTECINAINLWQVLGGLRRILPPVLLCALACTLYQTCHCSVHASSQPGDVVQLWHHLKFTIL